MFFLNSIFTISIALVCISLNACSSTPTNTAAMNSSSKYSPALRSSSDIDRHIETISKDSRKPVADEIGSYYFEIKNQQIAKAFLSASDGEEVKKILQKGTGLMLPVYRVQNSRKWGLEKSPAPEVVADWAASRKRWTYLTEKLKLKLLPFRATEKFDETLINTSLQQDSPYPNWYFNGFSIVIKRSGYTPDYLIDNGLTQERFRLGPISKDTSKATELDGSDINTFFYNYYGSVVTDTNYIAFLPMRVYDKMKSGSVYVNSSCHLLNINDYKNLTNEFSNRTGILAALDGLHRTKNSRSGRNIDKDLWKNYQSVLSTQGKADGDIEQFCESGLRALGLTGHIVSSTLE